MGIGRPRLDKYERLIARFYEALIVLLIEQNVQGLHIITSYGDSSLIASQRRFIRNLAFICDTKKGGETTTSIAIQSREDCFVFWVASNLKHGYKVADESDASGSQTIEFLKTILAQIKNTTTLSAVQRAREENLIAQRCAEFACRRLKKERKILSNAVVKCLGHIQDNNIGRVDITPSEINALERWLRQFQFVTTEDGYTACQLAYNARNAPQMRTLEKLSQPFVDGSHDEVMLEPCRTARHFVGRLADHIRVPKQLVEDAARVKNLLDVYKVAAVEPPRCVPAPTADSHTTLDGIVARMYHQGDEGLEDFRQYLSQLGEQVNYKERIDDKYNKMAAKPPVVHSEIRVLEHFHRNKFTFADNDRFVGTSKPSCFCCKLYFRYHASRPVEPDSHEEAYLNWSPILLNEGSRDRCFIEQRDLFNQIIHDIRNAALEWVRNKHSARFRHPNSITGLSRSADSHRHSDPVSQDGNNHAMIDHDTSSTDDPESDFEGGAPL